MEEEKKKKDVNYTSQIQTRSFRSANQHGGAYIGAGLHLWEHHRCANHTRCSVLYIFYGWDVYCIIIYIKSLLFVLFLSRRYFVQSDAAYFTTRAIGIYSIKVKGYVMNTCYRARVPEFSYR